MMGLLLKSRAIRSQLSISFAIFAEQRTLCSTSFFLVQPDSFNSRLVLLQLYWPGRDCVSNIAIMRVAWMHEKALKCQSHIKILDIDLI